jgi:hypothetical protein
LATLEVVWAEFSVDAVCCGFGRTSIYPEFGIRKRTGSKLKVTKIQTTCPMFSLDALFCHVDDFCAYFEPKWQQKLLEQGGIKRVRTRSLCLSEMMTILIAFHQNHYRNFKHFYLSQVKQHWHSAIPATSELSEIRRVDAIDSDCFVCLSQTLFW